MIDAATEAALAAGAIIRDALGDGISAPPLPDGIDGSAAVVHKGAIDLVTRVDLASEEVIRSVLAQATPGIPVLAEEGGGATNIDTRWIVDPLDGTTNFVHGFPAYAVSIALQQAGVITVGCIYDPLRDQLYTATRGKGAFCTDRQRSVHRRLQVTQTSDLSRALLLTGFPYDRQQRAGEYLRIVQVFMERCQGIRRAGAAALDLAHIAAGRADGFWEFGLSPWDIAAGVLLIEEAGGQVTDMSLSPIDIDRPRLLASNGQIHAQMGVILSELIS